MDKIVVLILLKGKYNQQLFEKLNTDKSRK